MMGYVSFLLKIPYHQFRVNPYGVNRISAIAPSKKRSKNDARGRDRVEINCEIVAGLKLAAKHRARSGMPALTRIRTSDLPLAIPRYSARSSDCWPICRPIALILLNITPRGSYLILTSNRTTRRSHCSVSERK